MNETSSIRNLKGIGEKTEKLFARVGVKTVGDLLAYYPRGYDVYREPVAIGQVKDQERAAVTGTVSGSVEVKRTRNLTVISTVISDLTGRCRLTWFNMPFLVNTLKRGSTFVFRGKVVFKGNLRVMEHPEIYTPAAYQEKQDSMQPIYGLTAGLTNNQVTKAVRQALENLDLSRDYLPEELRLQEGLAEYNFALSQIHFPKDQECYITARNRLAFDEFLLFILGIQRLKEKTGREENHYRMKEVWKTEEVMENLPYQLTGAQKNVWYEIERDLKGEKLMARLVQGDVGSGKTIIAFLAMIMAAENGYQSAVMAPTEVLARQHFEALEKLRGKTGCWMSAARYCWWAPAQRRRSGGFTSR
ncbi:MAG: DEAD/DEAH box helicase [Lachnospiraceae bacterium]